MHFSVGVFVKANSEEEAQNSLDDILERFNENSDVYKEFCCEEIPEHLQIEYDELSDEDKEKYPDLDAYASEYYGYEKVDDSYGYYGNPEGRWDWWQLGGRWDGCIPLKNGAEVNIAKVKDIQFIEPEHEARIKELTKYWTDYHNCPEPTDETLAEEYKKWVGKELGDIDLDDPVKVSEVHSEIRDAYWKSINVDAFHYLFDKEVGTYDLETFIKLRMQFLVYAYINEDNEWICKEDMETTEFAEKFNETATNLINSEDADKWYLIMVDCHD